MNARAQLQVIDGRARDYRTPPHAPEAEINVLGAVLMDPAALAKTLEVIDETMLYREAHRRIFRAMCRLFTRGAPVEWVALREELDRSNELEKVGGAEYLFEIADATPTAANVVYWAGLIRETAVRRQLIEASHANIHDAYEPGEKTVQQIVDAAGVRVSECARSDSSQGLVWIKRDGWETFEQIERRQNAAGGITGISSGLHGIDDLTGGFQKSDLIIVAARPSMGKTAIALSFALSSAIKAQKPVAVFSLEMSKHQLIQRMLCAEGRIDLGRVLRGQMIDDDYVRLAQAATPVLNAPIYIDDTGGIGINQLRARARRMNAEHSELGLIIVDYIQLMDGGNEENRNQEVSKISAGLKGLAKELNVPIIALSQLSRSIEGRQEKRPQLSDLRDSGSLEQDADLVCFLYRPDYYDRPKAVRDGSLGLTEFIIRKQRNGPTDTALIRFRESFTRFDNL